MVLMLERRNISLFKTRVISIDFADKNEIENNVF